jgi:hypothetical protein
MGKQYAERDIMALDKHGGHYTRHLSAMTGEALHDKSDIAAELAWRDAEIARLERERDAYRNAEETQIALRERVQEELNASLEREALKQAEVLDRLTELLKETHLDKAPNTARACMHVNDAINRVKQEVRPIRLSCRAEGHQ